jgi:hypothetical protein
LNFLKDNSILPSKRRKKTKMIEVIGRNMFRSLRLTVHISFIVEIICPYKLLESLLIFLEI